MLSVIEEFVSICIHVYAVLRKKFWYIQIYPCQYLYIISKNLKFFPSLGNNLYKKLFSNKRIYAHTYASFSSSLLFLASLVPSLAFSYLWLHPISHIHHFLYILKTCNPDPSSIFLNSNLILTYNH